MDPATIGLIAGAGANAIGGFVGNAMGARESKRNRQFQERMRGSQYQAAVADMRAAGLNPALAYSQGGAGNLSGSTAGQSNPLEGVTSSAMQAARAAQELKLLKEQIRKTQGEADTAEAIGNRERARNAAYGVQFDPDGTLRIDPTGAPGIFRETEAIIDERVAQAAQLWNLARMSGVGADAAGIASNLLPVAGRFVGTAARGLNRIGDTVDYLERLSRLSQETLRRLYGTTKEEVRQQLSRARQEVGGRFNQIKRGFPW